MKIYTRTGDKGTTALFGAGRVKKHDLRIEAFGTVDETNSAVGVARAHMQGVDTVRELDETLHLVQEKLFDVGADLATPLGSKAQIARITSEDGTNLEQLIDRYEEGVSPLKHFILPGGSHAAAFLHQARTVCRRAERLVSRLRESDEINEQTLIFLNRLSDFLFVAARWTNAREAIEETIWRGANRT